MKLSLNGPSLEGAEPRQESAVPARRPFTPSRRQRMYLDAWLSPTQPKSIHGICQALGLPRSNVYYWLQQPAFVEWFNRALDDHTEHMWRPILVKIGQLALQGSAEHAKLLAQIRGAIRHADHDVRGGGITVVVGIPRAGDVVPVPQEPRPLLASRISSDCGH